MFTQLELKALDIFFRILTKFPACPYDYEHGQLLRTKSKYRIYVWGTYMLLMIAWLPVTLVQMKRTVSDGNIPNMVFSNIYCVGVVGMAPIELSLWLYRDELAGFVNGTQSMNREFGSRHRRTLHKIQNRIRERIFPLLILSFTAATLVYAGFLLSTRNSTFSIYYFLWHDLNLNPALALILFFGLTLMICTEIVGTGSLQAVGFYFIMSTIFWTRKACIEWPEADVYPATSISAYKCCLLLSKRLNDGLGRAYIPTFKCLLMYLWLTASFALICFFDKLGWIPGCSMILFTIVSLGTITPGAVLMSTAYNISSKFHLNLTRRIQRMEARPAVRLVLMKDLLACQVIRCNIGNFYYMESKAKLSLAQNLLNWLMFLIIKNSSG